LLNSNPFKDTIQNKSQSYNLDRFYIRNLPAIELGGISQIFFNSFGKNPTFDFQNQTQQTKAIFNNKIKGK
jgi:hypothetical protein